MANETLTGAFSDIADAIRAKGVEGTMTPLEMPAKIADIPSGSGTRYGVGGDALLGPVDANGVLQVPNTPFSFSSSDIVTINQNTLTQFFSNFKNKPNLTSVNLPSLTTVYSSSGGASQGGLAACFMGITTLSSVIMPSLTTLTSRSGTFTYAGACESMCQGCTYLTEVDMSSLSSVGAGALQSAFQGCSRLTNVNLSSISDVQGTSYGGMQNTFFNCTSLSSIDISGDKTYLGMNAFNQCFRGCTSLRIVDMSDWGNPGNNGNTMMTMMFYGCSSLEVINFDGIQYVPPFGTNMFGNTNSTFKIVVPDALYETWIATSGWSDFAAQIVKESEYVPAS